MTQASHYKSHIITVRHSRQDFFKKDNDGMEDAYHQGAWLKRQIQRIGSNAAFARRVGIARETLQRLFQDRELMIRPHNTWRILDELGFTKDAELLGFVNQAEPEPKNRPEEWAAEMWSTHVFKEIMRAQQLGKIENPDAAAGKIATKHRNVDAKAVIASEVPTFDLAVAAGPWTEVSEVAELREDRDIDNGRFRIKIRGNSMEPKWPNGSLVEFRCLRWSIEPFEVGKDYYIQVDSNATFKRLVKAKDSQLTFVAINKKKYPDPILVRPEEIVRVALGVYILIDPND